MAVFCLPKNQVEKLKQSALKGEIDIKKLYEMSSEERRAFFTKHTDGQLGTFLNTEFEKAMVSKQQGAITDWAKSVFKPEMKSTPVYKNVLDKIKALDELGVMDPRTERAFLEDLVSDRLGVRVTPAEVREIAGKARTIAEAQTKLGEDLGNPKKAQENLEFFKAKKEMDDYLQGLSPGSQLKVTTGTIGRGMMLASVKSPLLNIGSNIEIGFMEALGRRAASGRIIGADNGLAVEYVKLVNKIYQATGYDISRMTKLSDTGASGQRVLGDTVHSQGPGAVRKAGRVVEDIVFKQLMGAPDVAFSSAHFADSVNLNSMKIAKGDRALAREYMGDAMRLEPKTPQGELLRAQGILDAQVATWTDRTWASQVSEGIRKILNEVSGDARVGDFILPFVKTPANVIATGMDYAGFGIPKAAWKTIKALRTGELSNPMVLRSIGRDLARAGLGITGAYIISSQLNDDDFMAAYDPARAQIEQLRNSNTNSVRIGKKWISIDWFGPLAVPITAIMYSRKYGDTKREMAFQYGKGMFSAIEQLPGVSEVSDFVRTQTSKKNQSFNEMLDTSKTWAIDQASARLMPSFIGDFAKSQDQYERKAQKGTEAFKAKIPGLRETLPVKTNIFGEEIKTESAMSIILFGSRVKTDKETDLTKELGRLVDQTGKGVAFTDWDKSSSKSLSEFRQKFGEGKYAEAKKQYGQELKARLEQVIGKEEYKKMGDEDKLAAINALDSEVTKKIFDRYGFKPTKAASKKNTL